MANPQTDDSFVSIATELFEALIKLRISGVENQCLRFIIRKTYGWNKKEDWIALSQFVEATGLSKPHVVRALGQLRKKNIITKKDNGKGVSYGIQKDYDKWSPLPKKVTLPLLVKPLPKKVTRVAKKDKASLPLLGTTKDTSTIDTVTKDTLTINIPNWIPKEEWGDYVEMRIENKFPLTNRAAKAAVNKLEKLKKEGSSPKDVLNNSVLCGYRGLFETKGRDNGQVSKASSGRSTGLADKDYSKGVF